MASSFLSILNISRRKYWKISLLNFFFLETLYNLTFGIIESALYFLTLLEITDEIFTCFCICLSSLTMFTVVFELAFIAPNLDSLVAYCEISLGPFSVSASQSLNKLALVNATIMPSIDACSIRFSKFVLSLISVPIYKLFFTITML